MSLKNPTVHREIYDAIKQQVIPVVESERNLIINVSSGTPAMHAVWLVLYAGGCFPNGTRLVSSQIIRKTNALSVDDVDFPITTYLSEVREFERENPNVLVYQRVEKSHARRDAL